MSRFYVRRVQCICTRYKQRATLSMFSKNDYLQLLSMSLITPSSRPKGPYKGGARRNDNNRIYASPLPLLFIEPPPSRVTSILGLLGLSLTHIENPHCEGIFDPTTRSVWVSNIDHSMLLWRRGFFGKGDLSRSEPSWLARQINTRKMGGKRAYIRSLPHTQY